MTVGDQEIDSSTIHLWLLELVRALNPWFVPTGINDNLTRLYVIDLSWQGASAFANCRQSIIELGDRSVFGGDLRFTPPSPFLHQIRENVSHLAVKYAPFAGESLHRNEFAK
jgi:hypothetical protein